MKILYTSKFKNSLAVGIGGIANKIETKYTIGNAAVMKKQISSQFPKSMFCCWNLSMILGS